MSKYRKDFTPAQKKAYAEEKRAEATERFNEALATLATSEGFERWVRARSRFHNYSWGNVLLILMQNPDATRCASYKVWQDLGRQVKKGERGLWIRVPAPVKIKDESGKPIKDESGREKRIMRFKGGHTFDIAQTEGDPLPEGPGVEPLSGDSHAGLLEPLTAFAEGLGYTVEPRDLSGMDCGGWHDGIKKLIVLDSSVSPNMQVHTLTHEIAHALGVTYSDYPRAEAEVIVEAAAHIALSVAGLDCGTYSVGYVAGWGKGDLKQLQSVAAKIDATAKQLGEALDTERVPETVSAAA